MKTMLLALLQLCALVCALSCATSTQAAPPSAQLSAHVQPTSVTLGEPLLLTISLKGSAPTLDELDLQPLQADFYTQSVSSGSGSTQQQGRTEVVQQMAITLYPLRSGTLTIPPLALPPFRTAAVSVKVQETGPAGTRVVASLAQPEPWVRQETVLRLDIYSDSNLIWSPVRLAPMRGLYLGAPSETEQQVSVGNDKITLHRYTWPVSALQAGNFSLPLPLLEATRFGTTLRYAVAPLTFHARPVPSYLPVDLPVGKPWVSPVALPSQSVVDQPQNWAFTLGGGVSRQYLKGVLARMTPAATLKHYPASITPVTGTDAAPGLALQVSLPFRPLQPGATRLPDIDLPYFDPENGTIESIRLAGPLLQVARRPGLSWLTPADWALGVLTLTSLIMLARLMRSPIARLRLRRRVLRNLHAAQSPGQIGAALMACTLADPSTVRTLSSWLNNMRLDCSTALHQPLCLLVEELEQATFGTGKDPLNLEDLRKRAICALPYLPLAKASKITLVNRLAQHL